jgi:transposase
MTRSFHPCDREQLMMLPPSVADWIPEDDLSRLVIEAVEQFDLRPFYAKYKDGSGQSAYRPEVMISLLLLAYCQGIRSSRSIERLCVNDIRFRMVTCNLMPDHTTIARFRSGWRKELQALFVQVLELCAQAGLVKLGAVAIDGTKIKANAAMESNRSRQQLAQMVEQMLNEADQADAQEDAAAAPSRSEDLPEGLRTSASRAASLRAARERIERTSQAYGKADAKARKQMNKYDEKIERQRARQAQTGKKPAGHKIKPPTDQQLDEPKANLSDPGSELMRGRSGFIQGYNAQAAVDTQSQVIVATAVSYLGTDMGQLAPMMRQMRRALECAAIARLPAAVLADAGYWTCDSLADAYNEAQQMEPAAQLLMAVPSRYSKLKDAPLAGQPPPQDACLELRLEHLQRSPEGQKLYQQRAQSVEPVFGQIKHNLKFDRFSMRGPDKANAEWSLMCTAHNLLKLWRRQCSQN